MIGITATGGVPSESTVDLYGKVEITAKGVDMVKQGVDLINGHEISDLSKFLGFYGTAINKASNVIKASDFVRYCEAECNDISRFYDE